jgi:hypothetical protein
MRLNQTAMASGETPKELSTDQTLLEATLTRTLQLIESDSSFTPNLVAALKEAADANQFSHASRIYRLLEESDPQ